MDRALIGLAFAAGLVAALNPCGFAMLPAYLLLVVRGQQPAERALTAEKSPKSRRQCTLGARSATSPIGTLGARSATSPIGKLGRALAATAGMALGFLTVFGVFGALTISVASTVERYLPYATVAIGVVIVALGIWLLAGRELTALTPRALGPRWAPGVRLGSMYSYGVSYAIASLSCTIGPFLAVTAAGLKGSVVTGVAIYLAYVAGLTLVVGALAVAAGTAGCALADRLRRVLPFVNRTGGVLLVLVGLYVGYYGAYELRLFTANADPRDAVIMSAGRLQGALAGWVHRYGALPWAAGLFVLAAGAFAAGWRGRGRRLPEPAAPTAPQVADEEEQRHRGETDQPEVLDVPDVVTAQHREQENDDEHAEAVPGAVIDPAPTPRC
ncbi:cytochrome C biogenesis protein CcdA [Mycobacterium parmense]|uniref:Cytochrome C biogenesis protein CcdA n=1 Tax=Mycobacterium parmense TaxID=185642 RepID=A0A7I7YVJ4_9MYCO|nr:cytochrome c biogenesis protein CcdA [Mycobacterium parmense]BBZ45014.1 cytochrome C biogenesis protein CcdA [Mycobacterium parmense]